MRTSLHYLKFLTCTLIILLVISLLSLQAQDYLISFAGSGGSATVDSVKIENLIQGTKLQMKGNDVLHLMAVVTGIETVRNSETGKISFYPNPTKDYARMQFDLPESGETIITVFDLSGREIVQTRDLLLKGLHVYGIQGIEKGLNVVRINSGRYSYSGRLICFGSQNKGAKIVYENTLAVQDKPGESKGTNAQIVMQYTTGNRLKITAFAGDYSTVITDVPTSGKTITFNFIAFTDGDGNNYPVVQIGSQIWMAENLKATKLNDGTPIDNVTDASAWSALYTPAYCLWGNDAANKDVYGVLYNWYTVNTGMLCPTDWHVSMDDDWKTLEKYVVGDWDAGKLKETGTTHWPSPNSLATNETGFTALPGGHRGDLGTFYAKGSNGQFWCSTEYSYTKAWNRGILYESDEVLRKNNSKVCGFSVRCVKD
jgi:uncharacterized protein (TIGR02145 family)